MTNNNKSELEGSKSMGVIIGMIIGAFVASCFWVFVIYTQSGRYPQRSDML